jgi:Icc protein
MKGLSPLVVAQITDIHLFADSDRNLLGICTDESWNSVLIQVNKLPQRPDLLLLTGDLSQDGKAGSYQKIVDSVEQLGIPTYWLPGNHDQVSTMEQVLRSGIVSAEKSFARGNWQFLLLNSQSVGCVHGYLAPETLVWLNQELGSNPDKPTLIALHHPPFAVGSSWLDDSALQNSEELFMVLERHPQVKLVLFGHIHQEFSKWHNGVQFFGTPSTCIQFEPGSEDFALGKVKPGFRLLYLYPDQTWWTTVERTEFVAEMNLAATGY